MHKQVLCWLVATVAVTRYEKNTRLRYIPYIAGTPAVLCGTQPSQAIILAKSSASDAMAAPAPDMWSDCMSPSSAAATRLWSSAQTPLAVVIGMIKPIAYRTPWSIRSAVSYQIHHAYCLCMRSLQRAPTHCHARQRQPAGEDVRAIRRRGRR